MCVRHAVYSKHSGQLIARCVLPPIDREAMLSVILASQFKVKGFKDGMEARFVVRLAEAI